jgi:hypothetical protein
MENFSNISTNNGNSSSSETKADPTVDLKSLSSEVLKDLQLKKGKKAKFIKHLEKLNEVIIE